MTARDVEALLLNRCATVARDSALSAVDQREANVFMLAASVMSSQFPEDCERLWRACEGYFLSHPGEQLEPEEVLQRGWVQDVSRLRLMLDRRLAEEGA
jgi:hypothetical protein